MKRLLIKTLPLVTLAVLASDLLYLYYAGGWCEPNVIIEAIEIITLNGLVIGSLMLTVYYLVRR